jgi:hypothetical protein
MKAQYPFLEQQAVVAVLNVEDQARHLVVAGTGVARAVALEARCLWSAPGSPGRACANRPSWFA